MPSSLLAKYAKTEARWDEMLDEALAPRPHWSRFLGDLAGLPVETLQRRSQFVNDSIASDGVTYNAYADSKSTSRRWELDLLPLIIPADEWQHIASSVAQRARLLNAVLGDLYGPQNLIAEGLVPPALVFGQRSYLWPAHGIVPSEGVALHVYAADLARSPDGRWWVLADRTRAPAGAGYALSNRMTLARAFPDAFRELHVEELAPFFSALQDSLFRLSNPQGEAPLAVLLTPGPYSEAYFEHSFLARYLGFPLVEGQDLVVRGDRLFLKTLRGLRRVHAILRRLDDEFCDPVELRADSAIGIPGLMHVVRAGNVVVANALGSAVLETAAFTGFYPKMNERLFGESLTMPSIGTWWCGEAPALEYVLSHLDELVIKPAYPTMRMDAVFGHSLDAAARADLVERMQRQPHAYVAQEWLKLSHAPTWNAEDHSLKAKATTLRVFAVWTPNGYMVMPGGLTRVARHEDDMVSMQWGGSSKDTWMLAHQPVTRVPLRRPRVGAADVATSAVDVASRVGENLFWMGRYAERCEGLARVLRAALVRIADAAPQSMQALPSLLAAAERLEIVPEDGDESDFVAAVVDPEVAAGLAANVLRLQASAAHVRERMSTDNWHVFNRLPQRLARPTATLGEALESVDEIMMACVSLAGFALDDMTRDESWEFLLLGRRLERLAHLAALVGFVVDMRPHPSRDAALEWLLEASNSIVTFRARYRRAPELLPVLHLVVFDASNPHSVMFQLRELASIRQAIAEELGTSFDDPLASASEALSRVELDPFELETGDALEEACKALGALMVRIEEGAYEVSDDAQRRFFSHAATPAPMGVPA